MNAEITVRELARYSTLNVTVAVGGPGLDRPVRWAHSTELLDPRPYLHGGELVLTVGSGLTDPERCAAFVHALTECRVAALGLGIGDVHNGPPEALLTSCEEAAIPLLLVPPTTPFIEITELLAEHRIRQASDRSRRTTVGRLAEAVLRRQATAELLIDDVRSAGLDPRHLTASVWPKSIDEPLLRRFDSSSHLLGELPDCLLLLTSDAQVAEQAAGSLGVATHCTDPFDLDDLAEEVEALLEAWSQRNDGGGDDAATVAPMHARRRSHFTYLVNAMPQESLDPLLTDLVEPLTEHDEANGSHLVESLEVFLQHDGSVQAAARTMHLHPNSLRHRLTRIYELTGRNPLLFRDQVDFALALEALRRRSHTDPA